MGLGGGYAAFWKKPGKNFCADGVSVHYGEYTGVIPSASGGILYGYVQFWITDSVLRGQLHGVPEDAVLSLQTIRKLSASSWGPPRPHSTQ